MTVALELLAGVPGPSAPYSVGSITAITRPGFPDKLIESAADPYAAALLVSQMIIPAFPMELTVDIAADAQQLDHIVGFLAVKQLPVAWIIKCGGTVDVAFAAVTWRTAPLATTGDTVSIFAELRPTSTADMSGNDIVTGMLDLRDSDNLINAMTFGGL